MFNGDDESVGRSRSLRRMRGQKTAVILSLVIAGMATTYVATAAGCDRQHTLSDHRLKRIALKASTQAGDPNPSLIQHVPGRREEANKVASGGIVPGTAWCYLIAVRGKFVLNNVSRPLGAKAPTGTVMTLVVNARTGATMDFGVSDRYPDLSKLGPVTTDLGN